LQTLINAGKEFVVTVVNVRTGETVYVSTNQVKNGEIKNTTFVKATVASCSEPAFTKPIRIFEDEPASLMKNDLFYDGGVREFMPFEKAVASGADEIWAVSTHPLATEKTAWGGNTDPDHVNIVKVLGWTIGAALNEVERDDLFRAYVYHRQGWARERIKIIADGLGIAQAERDRLTAVCDNMFPGQRKLAKLFVVNPSQPMQTSMEFDPAVMQNYFIDGWLEAERFFQNGAPEFVEAGDWLLPDIV
jgi:predicted acylesterase/phospholipase RssA